MLSLSWRDNSSWISWVRCASGNVSFVGRLTVLRQCWSSTERLQKGSEYPFKSIFNKSLGGDPTLIWTSPCFSYFASTSVILKTPFSWGHLKAWSWVEVKKSSWKKDLTCVGRSLQRGMNNLFGSTTFFSICSIISFLGVKFYNSNQLFMRFLSVHLKRLLITGRSAILATPPTPKSRVGFCRKKIWKETFCSDGKTWEPNDQLHANENLI